jgi:hypothetical protein
MGNANPPPTRIQGIGFRIGVSTALAIVSRGSASAGMMSASFHHRHEQEEGHLAQRHCSLAAAPDTNIQNHARDAAPTTSPPTNANSVPTYPHVGSANTCAETPRPPALPKAAAPTRAGRRDSRNVNTAYGSDSEHERASATRLRHVGGSRG